MEDNTNPQGRIDQLAILACEISGYNPFHEVEGQPLYKTARAQARAHKVISILSGAGELPLLEGQQIN